MTLQKGGTGKTLTVLRVVKQTIYCCSVPVEAAHNTVGTMVVTRKPGTRKTSSKLLVYQRPRSCCTARRSRGMDRHCCHGR